MPSFPKFIRWPLIIIIGGLVACAEHRDSSSIKTALTEPAALNEPILEPAKSRLETTESGTATAETAPEENPAAAATPEPATPVVNSPVPPVTPAAPPLLPVPGEEVDTPSVVTDLPPMRPPRPREPDAPKPPALPEEAADPAEIGVPLLDAALRGEASRGVLPFWHGYPWQKVTHPVTWTRETLALIKANPILVKTVPADYQWYCPNYPNLQEEERAIVWMRLLSILAELESSYDPIKTYHSVRVEWGLFSTGLMMLSLPSSKHARFGCSMIKTQDDLFEWRKNLACAVRIMGSFVGEDKVIGGHSRTDENSGRWMGLARYWEGFRDWRMEYPELRYALLDKIKHSRKMWLEEGASKWHPAYKDSEYASKKEPILERIYRLMNQMPLCLTGTSDDFADGPIPEDPPPLPRPRPRLPTDPPPGTVTLPETAPLPTPRPADAPSEPAVSAGNPGPTAGPSPVAP